MPIPLKEQRHIADVLSLYSLNFASRKDGVGQLAEEALEGFTDGYMRDVTKITALRAAVKVRGGFYNKEEPMTMETFSELIADYGWQTFCTAIRNQSYDDNRTAVLTAIQSALSKAGFNYT